MALSETFGRVDQPSILTPIDGYATWNTNRGGSDKGGGGLTMLYKETLTAHQYTPSVPPHLEYIMNERQWLLLNNAKDRCAFLHVYIACQSTKSDSFLQWNEDLFYLITQEAIKLKQQGFIVLAMGDFNSRVGAIKGLEDNTPDTNRNTPMFLNFLNEVNLMIINTLPLAKGLFTRFMDNSGRPGTRSVLDYGLIDPDVSNTVTSFVIDEEARVDCGSDHALLECILLFGSRPKVTWSFQEAIHYDIRENSSFTDYQSNLDLASSSIPLHTFTTLTTDQMLPHISESINDSAMKTFGLKVKKRKRGQKLPRSVISLIRAKNDFAKKLISARPNSTQHQVERMQQELAAMKNQIKDSISAVKLQRRSHLRTKLLRADPSRKKFWRFLKSQIKSAGHISAVYDKSGLMVFDQEDIEEAVLNHFEKIFLGKRIPVYELDAVPDQIALSILELDQIVFQNSPSFQPDQFEDKVCSPYSQNELDQILGKLSSGKSSGYDGIPNELLKNASFKFKQYLLIFLNQILKDGVVPQNLNLGKCMLIHKVCLFFKYHFISFNQFTILRVGILFNPVCTDP